MNGSALARTGSLNQGWMDDEFTGNKCCGVGLIEVAW